MTIMEICEEDEMDIALHHVVDVAGYLAQHSIEDESRVEIQAHGSGAIRSSGWPKTTRPICWSQALRSSPAQRMGLWRMTRDLLISSPICCLMSH